jgi:hypothetical protein
MPPTQTTRPSPFSPPQNHSVGGACAAEECTSQWLRLPGAPTKRVRQATRLLPVRALAPRRFRSFSRRWQQHLENLAARQRREVHKRLSPLEGISTLEQPPSVVRPPRTTKAPLTAQHAWPALALTREGMSAHRIVARSSLNQIQS